MAGQDDILRTMATAMQQIARNAPPSQSSIIKQMHEYHPEEFKGKLDDNPTKAEYWLEQLERIFGCMTCTSDEKLQGATALLKEEAHRWWASVVHDTLPDMLTWDFFLNKFRECYVGEQRDLRSIIQAGLVGLETSDLTKLSHAARTLEQLKVTDKVEEGSMNQEKRPAESSHSASRFSGKRFRDFRVLEDQTENRCECRNLLGTCFLCGSKDHYYRECLRGQVPSETRSAPGVQQGRGTGRGFGAARG
ncbi:hypothetical protein SASPL_135238 [Salvia splendens]|uniref:CCHC-type domain-containing protein n=1 Tax=Salvia splendens TaxID=180675 RepID=A0A8X8WZQ8_SALSN|nr:hypothetical protein SASPL_135238 [Salvia splendens]